MFHHKCPRNCLLIVLAVYLLKTGGGGRIHSAWWTHTLLQIIMKNILNLVKWLKM